MEMAQVPRSRRLSSLGHSHDDVLSKHYEKHEVIEFLLKDAQRCQSYINEAVDATYKPDGTERVEPQNYL